MKVKHHWENIVTKTEYKAAKQATENPYGMDVGTENEFTFRTMDEYKWIAENYVATNYLHPFKIVFQRTHFFSSQISWWNHSCFGTLARIFCCHIILSDSLIPSLESIVWWSSTLSFPGEKSQFEISFDKNFWIMFNCSTLYQFTMHNAQCTWSHFLFFPSFFVDNFLPSSLSTGKQLRLKIILQSVDLKDEKHDSMTKRQPYALYSGILMEIRSISTR